MKKIALSIAYLTAITAVNAGTMGPAASPPAVTPYVVGEASHTWLDTNKIIVNSITANRTDQGWGGRLGGGAIYNYSDALGFTSEIGGGSYGKQTQTIHNSAGSLVTSNKYTLDGYDVLAGAIYKMQYFDVFGEAGFMMENLRYNSTQNLNLVSPGGLLSGTVTQKGDNTQALPEIKVGGIYNLYPDWGFTVAYMHVFGSGPKVRETSSSTTTNIATNAYTNTLNPTLNSLMFGLRYNIK